MLLVYRLSLVPFVSIHIVGMSYVLYFMVEVSGSVVCVALALWGRLSLLCFG